MKHGNLTPVEQAIASALVKVLVRELSNPVVVRTYDEPAGWEPAGSEWTDVGAVERAADGQIIKTTLGLQRPRH